MTRSPNASFSTLRESFSGLEEGRMRGRAASSDHLYSKSRAMGILSATPHPSASRPPRIPTKGRRVARMLSRTADSLYWMGRYMERADFNARIMEAAMRLASLPADDAIPGGEWDSSHRHFRCSGGVLRGARRGDRGQRAGFPGLRPGQSVLDPILPRPGPRQRPRGANRPDHRGLGIHQRRLERVQPPETRQDGHAGLRSLFWSG